jgi:drug/metabolite transporter (DMT)-like permease
LATVFAVAGLVCSNLEHTRDLLAISNSLGESVVHRFLPYGLALVAAVTWAIYSASLARWRNWAGGYATSSAGFLITGAIASVIVGFTGSASVTPSFSALLMITCYGIGP